MLEGVKSPGFFYDFFFSSGEGGKRCFIVNLHVFAENSSVSLLLLFSLKVLISLTDFFLLWQRIQNSKTISMN